MTFDRLARRQERSFVAKALKIVADARKTGTRFLSASADLVVNEACGHQEMHAYLAQTWPRIPKMQRSRCR